MLFEKVKSIPMWTLLFQITHYLILQSLDEKYLQLGIARGKETDYLETSLCLLMIYSSKILF